MAEIVIVAGPPAAGKSTAVKPLVDAGYFRINRDEIGGSLKAGGDAYTAMVKAFQDGSRDFVLDNIYATKESRATVLNIGKQLGLPVRCVWIDATEAQAQFLASRRQIQRYGKLFTEADYKANKNDPNMFPPAAQFAYWKRVERPDASEGFTALEFRPVKIALGPEYVNRAVILDYDGTLRITTKEGAVYPTNPSEMEVLPGRKERLAQVVAKGFLLLGASNQSGIAKKPGEPKYVSEADAIRCFDYTNQLVGQDIKYLYAAEAAGMPKSFWRKPAPGMGVLLIERYKLDPAKCIYSGDMKTDETFAARCGFKFIHSDVFFSPTFDFEHFGF